MFPDVLFIRAILEMEGNALRLDLETRVKCSFVCDRCGRTYNQEHDCSDTFFYAFEDAQRLPMDSDQALIPRNAVDLDITQEIRDTVIIGLPVQFLCRADCKGLCSNCGVDLNLETCACPKHPVDPRWAALLKLKDQD
ncbi:MAG: DUF177 domain-containing protein [bacterium]|nr:DUF177 domain-containing protein [bacterium]